jgi:hypothetical protein
MRFQAYGRAIRSEDDTFNSLYEIQKRKVAIYGYGIYGVFQFSL